jgi:ribosome-associated protein
LARDSVDSEKLAKTVVDLVVAKLGEDVLLLDIRPVSTISDYFVICSGSTERQVEAIQDHIQTELKGIGMHPLHLEGTGASGWILMDYGSVVVHVFLPMTRDYYNLEQLWRNARTVLRIL